MVTVALATITLGETIMTHAIIPTPNFFTSDWHLGHENILKYDRRPFRDTECMLNALMANYNRVVDTGSTVVFLGDVFFCESKYGASSIMRRLHGRKHLILGNHDRHSKTWYRDVGFDVVLDSATILDELAGAVTVIHNPLHAVGPRQSNYVIHGHRHSIEPASNVGDVRRVDVGVVAWGYYPAPATKVIDLLRVF